MCVCVCVCVCVCLSLSPLHTGIVARVGVRVSFGKSTSANDHIEGGEGNTDDEELRWLRESAEGGGDVAVEYEGEGMKLMSLYACCCG